MYTPTRNGGRIVGNKFVPGQREGELGSGWEGLNLNPARNWIKAKGDRGTSR